MIYGFLTDEDLKDIIKDEFLNTLKGTSDTRIPKMCTTAIDFMSGYLGQRYQVADIFPSILQWSSSTDFKATPVDNLGKYYRVDGLVKNYCYNEGIIYKALTDNTNKPPAANPSDWAVSDPRNSLVVSYAADIAVFKLHTHINPRKIPDLRVELYNQAKEWLALVKDGDLTPDLPRNGADATDTVDTIFWGSQKQQSHYF